MNEQYILGIGLIAKSIGEALVDKNYAVAATDFFKGLGQFNLHLNIQDALKAPRGEAAPKFMNLNIPLPE
jgi:prephenate dehydrogenase